MNVADFIASDCGMKSIGRVRAALFHLLISVAIAILLSFFVFTVWYPAPLTHATNVLHIFILIVVVDVVIGPLITLIIFNTEKKELKWDLTVIAVLQLSALAYGVVVVHESRPVYLVFNVDRFDLVRANDLALENINAAKIDAFKQLPHWGPELVVAVRPDDLDERQKILFSSLNGGDDLPFMPRYYEPYVQRISEVKLKTLNIDLLLSFNKASLADINSLKKKYETKKLQIGYLPLKGPHKDLSVIINKDSGEVIEIVDLNPW